MDLPSCGLPRVSFRSAWDGHLQRAWGPSPDLSGRGTGPWCPRHIPGPPGTSCSRGGGLVQAQTRLQLSGSHARYVQHPFPHSAPESSPWLWEPSRLTCGHVRDNSQRRCSQPGAVGTVLLGNSPGSIYLLRGQQRCHHTCVLTSPPFPLSSPHAVIIASCNHLPQISPAPLGEPTLRHTESESGNVPGNCTYAHSLGGFQALLTWRVLPAVGFPCVRTKGPACKSCWAVNVLGTFHPPP